MQKNVKSEDAKKTEEEIGVNTSSGEKKKTYKEALKSEADQGNTR